MIRTCILLATILFLALGILPRASVAQALLAQAEEDASQAGSAEPPLADAVDQPTAGELRRLRRQMAEGGEEENGLPPPEAISPEIDIMVPAPEEFQEP